MNNKINILQLCQQGSRALGPGLRYIIWVQGCPFKCPHCETPEGHSFEPNRLIEIKELAFDIIQRKEIEGITISGGEPFEQADLLADLLTTVLAERPELNVISYTGYQLEELISDSAKRYMSLLDVLIDGKYIHEKNDDIGIRGSSNQRVLFLTDKLKAYENELTKGKRKLEIRFHGNDVTVIGLLKKDKIK